MSGDKSFLEYVFDAGGLPIGLSITSGNKISIKDTERSTYIIGTHGVGKSTLLLNIILADIKSEDKAIVVLDPHGDLARDVIQRVSPKDANRIIYFAPGIEEQAENPIPVNPFQWSSQQEYNFKLKAIMKVFTHLWYGSFENTPQMQNVLETLVQTLLDAYKTYNTSFYHMHLMLRKDSIGEGIRKKLLSEVSNPSIRSKLEQWVDFDALENKGRRHAFGEVTASSANKVDHLVANTTVLNLLSCGKSANCFDFRRLFRERGVLVVNLNGLDAEGQKLIGSVLLTQLTVEAQLQEENERYPCHIIADEFYNFSPSSFVTIINECRKYGLHVSVAHQALAQLTEDSKAAALNCANKVYYQTNANDAMVLARDFVGLESFQEISTQPRYHAFARLDNGKDAPMQAKVKVHPNKIAPSKEIEKIIRTNSLKYSRSLDDIRKYISEAEQLGDIFIEVVEESTDNKIPGKQMVQQESLANNARDKSAKKENQPIKDVTVNKTVVANPVPPKGSTVEPEVNSTPQQNNYKKDNNNNSSQGNKQKGYNHHHNGRRKQQFSRPKGTPPKAPQGKDPRA